MFLREQIDEYSDFSSRGESKGTNRKITGEQEKFDPLGRASFYKLSKLDKET